MEPHPSEWCIHITTILHHKENHDERTHSLAYDISVTVRVDEYRLDRLYANEPPGYSHLLSNAQHISSRETLAERLPGD
jgi:hypothetical protein